MIKVSQNSLLESELLNRIVFNLQLKSSKKIFFGGKRFNTVFEKLKKEKSQIIWLHKFPVFSFFVF